MDEFRTIVDNVKDRMEKVGLYMVDAMVATDNEKVAIGGEGDDGEVDPNIRGMIEDGEARFAIMAQFNIGDVAFSDRVLNPESYEEDTEFREMMPTEAELIKERLKGSGSLRDAFRSEDEGEVDPGTDS